MNKHYAPVHDSTGRLMASVAQVNSAAGVFNLGDRVTCTNVETGEISSGKVAEVKYRGRLDDVLAVVWDAFPTEQPTLYLASQLEHFDASQYVVARVVGQ